MRECCVLCEINPSVPSLRFEACPYDNYESSPPLWYDFLDDAALIDLEQVFDRPFTSLSFVAPSSSITPMDTSISDLILFASPLPLD